MSHPEARSEQSDIAKIAERTSVPALVATGSTGLHSAALPHLLTPREFSQRSQPSRELSHHSDRRSDERDHPEANCRRMRSAELLGNHSHETADGRQVHIWIRSGRYMARGRHNGKAFGRDLGADQKEAIAVLRRLLVELEDGTFVSPSESKKRQLKARQAPRHSIRQLCDAFLVEKRSTRGKATADHYRQRLTPLIEFAEHPKNLPKWPLAADLDRDFAIQFRKFLHERTVARNGRAAAQQKPVSPGQIYNILDCARTLVNWARRPEVQHLPISLANPFTEDLVGRRPSKDPLREVIFPLDFRIQLAGQMDGWQLCQLSLPLVLPLRPEDFCGLLISEVDFDRRIMRFGTRLGGWDFNKGQQSFRVPFPAELAPLLRRCVANRAEGPLLRQRTIVNGRRRPKFNASSTAQIEDVFRREMAAAKPGVIQAPQDGKRLFRRLLRAMGGTSEDSLAKEFDQVLAASGLMAPQGARFYDLRSSTTTDLKAAHVDPLVRKYVTGHSLDAEIMSRYESIRLQSEMAPYFEYIKPLLGAITARSRQLGLEGRH